MTASTILFSEMLSRGAEAPPEIGEDDVRIAPVFPTNTETKLLPHFLQVKASLGMVPNLAHAPVALDGFLSLSKTAFAWTPFDVTRKTIN
jgi:hypothetical protein